MQLNFLCCLKPKTNVKNIYHVFEMLDFLSCARKLKYITKNKIVQAFKEATVLR